jgi:hypothetical protein
MHIAEFDLAKQWNDYCTGCQTVTPELNAVMLRKELSISFCDDEDV